MNLKALTNAEFLARFENKASFERHTLSDVIEYVLEANRREIYDELEYNSLFEFMKYHLKYSNGSAQRRIDAAFEVNQNPEILDWMKSGDLNLTQITTVVHAVAGKRKLTKVRLTAAEKLTLFRSVRNTSGLEAERIACAILDIPIKAKEQKHAQQDGSLRVECTFTPAQRALKDEIALWMSHAIPNPTVPEMFEHMARKILAPKESRTSRPSQASQNAKGEGMQEDSKAISNLEIKKVSAHSSDEIVSKMEIRKPPRRPSRRAERELKQTQPGCVWTYKSGKMCGERFQLQTDHKHSQWAGGNSKKANLQRLCAKHNRLKYRRESNTSMC